MARVVEEKIGNMTVKVVKHLPRAGLVLKARVLKLVGPALAEALPIIAAQFKDKPESEMSLAKLDIGKLMPALRTLCASMVPEDVPRLFDALLEQAVVVVPDAKGKLNQIELSTEGMIDLVFQDRPDGDLFRAALVSLKANAGFFFDAAATIVAAPAAAQTSSP